jgi:hypothetical protein
VQTEFLTEEKKRQCRSWENAEVIASIDKKLITDSQAAKKISKTQCFHLDKIVRIIWMYSNKYEDSY